jgi:hypothetical protein
MDTKPLFALGTVVATPGALHALVDAGQAPLEFLARHQAGDWGEVDPADAQENQVGIKEGYRIMSAYRTRLGVGLWVITEADRTVTTLLIPEDY